MSKLSSLAFSLSLTTPLKHSLNASCSFRALKDSLVNGVSSSCLYGNSMRDLRKSFLLASFGFLSVFGSVQSAHSYRHILITLKTYKCSSWRVQDFLTHNILGKKPAFSGLPDILFLDHCWIFSMHIVYSLDTLYSLSVLLID